MRSVRRRAIAALSDRSLSRRIRIELHTFLHFRSELSRPDCIPGLIARITRSKSAQFAVIAGFQEQTISSRSCIGSLWSEFRSAALMGGLCVCRCRGSCSKCVTTGAIGSCCPRC